MQATAPVALEDPETVGDDVDRVKSMEKDATELELERLIFGDDDGFYKGLRSHKDTAKVGDSAISGAIGEVNLNVDAQDGYLEAIHDEDVCLWILMHPRRSKRG